MASDDELEPLFPDLKDAFRGWEPRDMEEREEKEEWLRDSSWGAESGSIGKGGIMDELRKEKSAKKRLNFEGEEDMTEKKKKKKKSKSGELPKRSGRREDLIRRGGLIWIKFMLKLRDCCAVYAILLLFFPHFVRFDHHPMVYMRFPYFLRFDHHPKVYMRDFKPSGKENHEESKIDDVVEAVDCGSNATILSRCEDVTNSKASDTHLEDSFQNISMDSKQSNREYNQFDDGTNDTVDVLSPSLPASSSKLDPDDVSSSEEDNDKENIDPYPHKAGIMDSYPEGCPAKTFLDDEAEEEDDSDHDLMRFQENEEDDESDENEALDDLIATGFEEAPIDHEKRNQLHMKWLEQQDAAATDSVLQRLKCGKNQKEPTVLDEEDDEELGEDSEDEASYDLPSTNVVRNNSKKAKQMIAQMFTDNHDVYVPSDDEETEHTLIRRRLSNQPEESSFISPVEDEHSREVFGLIKKLNIAPDSRKRGKTSNFNMLMMGGNSNSSSKSSFLGRATSSSLPSSHKQGSTTVRTFIFSRDDSNSRSGISTTDNLSAMDQAENQPKHASTSKFSGSQLKPASKTKVEGNGSSGSSLFEILRQSSMIFDKQMEKKGQSRSHGITETQAAYQFSAFKLGKRLPKVETRN